MFFCGCAAVLRAASDRRPVTVQRVLCASGFTSTVHMFGLGMVAAFVVRQIANNCMKGTASLGPARRKLDSDAAQPLKQSVTPLFKRICVELQSCQAAIASTRFKSETPMQSSRLCVHINFRVLFLAKAPVHRGSA